MEPISIRPAQYGDLEVITTYQIACAKESEDRELNPQQVESGVRQVLPPRWRMPWRSKNGLVQKNGLPSLGEYFVAENTNGKVVACCLLQLQWSDWNSGYYLNIESVYVHRGYRGTGVLQQLYSDVEEMARILGKVSEIRSVVARENNPMHKALQKVAWEGTKYLVFSKNV